jgi:hypothetical protein
MSKSTSTKRVNSIEASIGSPILNKKNISRKIIKEESSEEEMVNRIMTRSSIQIIPAASKTTSTNSIPDINQTPYEQQDDDSNQDINNNENQVVTRDSKAAVRDLVRLAEQKKFLRKEFFFDDIRKTFTPILYFFQHDSQFNIRPSKPISFKCLICNEELNARIGRFTNLNRHINKHQTQNKDVKKWFELYAKFNTKSKVSQISSVMLNLVKYFISSNLSLNQLCNQYLRAALGECGLKLPNPTSFKDIILPQAVTIMKNKIIEKLQNASFVCLITDNWSSRQMMGFIAVAVNIINSTFDKETLVIGMRRTNGRQTAENLKVEIEEIVNEYEFLKKKIKGKLKRFSEKIKCSSFHLKGVSTDEGSNLLRLFKQVLNTNLVEKFGDPVAQEINAFDTVNPTTCSFDLYDDLYISSSDAPATNTVETSEYSLSLDLEEEIINLNLTRNCVADPQSITLPDMGDEVEFNLDGDFIDINTEIKRAINEVEKMSFDNVILLDNDPKSFKVNRVEFNEKDEYDPSLGDPIYELNINFGTNDIPRFSCACHKANIAVRLAIKKHKGLSTLLASLSCFAAKTRNSINKSHLHIDEKSRLRCENQTRWSSSFLMLESFKKCFDKNIFTSDHKPPASKETIEKYLQVLLHAYKFSMILQSNKSSVGEVVPSLLILLNTWKRMNLIGQAKDLRDNLVCAFEFKFEYELNSSIYLAASIMEVGKLRIWFKKSFAQEHIQSIRNSIKNVTLQFVKFDDKHQTDLTKAKTSAAANAKNIPRVLSAHSMASEDDLLSYMAVEDEEEGEHAEGLINARRGERVEKECDALFKLFEETDLKKIKSTRGFWYSNASKYPLISQLALILLNTPASSAFVERFFSICGIICHQRAGNMSAELIETRSLLRANLGLLEEDEEE